MKTKRKRRRSIIPYTPVEVFTAAVGRDPLSEALALSPDEKFENLGRLLADPAAARASLDRLCRQAGVKLADLHEFWKNRQYHLGMIQAYNRVPKILDDTFQDAESHDGPCTRCDGLGTVTDSSIDAEGAMVVSKPRECPVCHGAKHIRVIGDKAARDLVFESIGLTGKRPPAVAIQQNFSLDAELGDVLQLARKAITGGSEGGGG